jgi:hypothetical protein
MRRGSDAGCERTTNLENLKRSREHVVTLLGPPLQIVAEKQLLDTSDFVILFEGFLDRLQLTLI